jgi:ribonuclease HI
MTGRSLRVVLSIDGGARGNPGPAGAGFVLRAADDGTVLQEAGLFLGQTTNNVAEYRGLLAGLESAAKLGATQVEVLSDSELLVRQMTGLYRVRSENLKDLFEQARIFQTRFSKCTFRHIPREQNTAADRLVNRAINLRRNVDGATD